MASHSIDRVRAEALASGLPLVIPDLETVARHLAQGGDANARGRGRVGKFDAETWGRGDAGKIFHDTASGLWTNAEWKIVDSLPPNSPPP
jgi:hypothetical protein